VASGQSPNTFCLGDIEELRGCLAQARRPDAIAGEHEHEVIVRDAEFSGGIGELRYRGRHGTSQRAKARDHPNNM
jgi:hypothetical protein